MSVVIDAVRPGDAGAISSILSGWGDEVAWLPRVHSARQLRGFGALLIDKTTVIVAREGHAVVGFLARTPGEIQALYLRPEARGVGFGAQLLGHAMHGADAFGLWVFQANLGARRFYARHGFVEERRSDGCDNDECLPDVRLIWKRSMI